MSYGYYRKTKSFHSAPAVSTSPKVILKSERSNRKKITAGLLFALGLILLGSVLYPIVHFQFFTQDFKQLTSPVSAQFYNQTNKVLGEVTTDYTQLNNWFDPSNPPATGALDGTTSYSYQLAIPKLKIYNADVEIGSQDLKKSLVQYPNTALPGQAGSTVVFGHSVLPQFFDPKSYTTIFSTLYKLKDGDEIALTYDKVTYKYKVEEMYEVTPEDLSVLEQRYDGRFLTLITCHPPGTYLRRLVVRAKLQDI